MSKAQEIFNEPFKRQISRVLPKHISLEKFSRSGESFLNMRSELLECERNSLYAAILRAAQSGLYLDGIEASITSFRKNIGTKDKSKYIKQAQFMAGYQGLLKQVRQSGELATIGAWCVFEKDKFTRKITIEGEHIDHEPFDDGDPGKIIKAYAIAKTKDNAYYIEVMNRNDLDKIKACSKSQGGVWKTWEDEMCKKSVIRRLCKRLPKSTDLENTLKAEEEFFDLDATPEKPADSEPEKPKKEEPKKSRLETVIEEQSDVPL